MTSFAKIARLSGVLERLVSSGFLSGGGGSAGDNAEMAWTRFPIEH